ncbi:CHAT domain-containing protein [Succinivibrio dextrinosolvens]|uniref:CHAT domain-containing protein n=1 Tax=Succinivibrio dextrinosolvens TaxID=83771 RepID=UPI0019242F30|nr:CHAT domain-containing protein [Succinivibrio dextrinosolvens]
MNIRLKKTAMALAIGVGLFFSSFSYAETPEELFNKVDAAISKQDYKQASEILEQLADMFKEKSIDDAVVLWHNAAIAKINDKDYSGAEKLYAKIFSSTKKIPEDVKKALYNNLIFCQKELGNKIEVITSSDRYIKDFPKMDTTELINQYSLQGDMYRELELYTAAVNSYEKAKKRFSSKFDKTKTALILADLAFCQNKLGSFTDSIKNYEAAKNLAKEVKHYEVLAESISNLGIISWKRGDYKNARSILKEAEEIEKNNNLRRNEGADINNLGLIDRAYGDYDSAFGQFEKSRKIAIEIQNKQDEGIAVSNIAMIYLLKKDYPKAETEFKKSIELFKEVNFKEGLALATLGLATVYEFYDDNNKISYEKALSFLEESTELYGEIKSPFGLMQTLNQTGFLYREIYDGLLLISNSSDRIKLNDVKKEKEERIQKFQSAISNIKITKEEALQKVKEYGEKIQTLGKKYELKDLSWGGSWLQGYYSLKSHQSEKAENYFEEALLCLNDIFRSDAHDNGRNYKKDREKFFDDYESLFTTFRAQVYLKKEKGSELKDPSNMLAGNKQSSSKISVDDTENSSTDKLAQLEHLRAEHNRRSYIPALKFENDKQDSLHASLRDVSAELNAAKQTKVTLQARLSRDLTFSDDEIESVSDKKLASLIEVELKSQEANIKRLEGEYEKLLADWNKNYPTEKNLFASNKRVNLEELQKTLKSDQVILQYIALPDNLVIVSVSPKEIAVSSVDIDRDSLNNIIKEGFIINGIEKFRAKTNLLGAEDYDISNLKTTAKALNTLYNYLLKPVESVLGDHKRVYIISEGLLAQIPFGALVSGFNDKDQPNYFVEKYDVAYLRPSFAHQTSAQKQKKNGQIKKVLAIANARNENFPMDYLDGSIREVNSVKKALSLDKKQSDIAVGNVKWDSLETFKNTKDLQGSELIKAIFDNVDSHPVPTEKWVREQLSKNEYEIMYFATHGMPYSDTYITTQKLIANEKSGKSISDVQKIILKTSQKNLKEITPMNGFLYLSSNPGDDILSGKEIPENQDGLLTMKEIVQMPGSNFKNMNLIVLSACNTGVTYVPKAIASSGADGADLSKLFDTDTVGKELEEAGLEPGVDQVSFIETFMSKGVRNIYGTLWPVDDVAATVLMSKFAENMSQKDKYPDVITAYNAAQRTIIELSKNNIKDDAGNLVVPNTPVAYHPFYWAVGAVFGR